MDAEMDDVTDMKDDETTATADADSGATSAVDDAEVRVQHDAGDAVDAPAETAAPRRRVRTGPTVRERLGGWRWDWETVGWALVLVAAVATRLYLLGKRGMSHDESLHTFYSWQLAVGKGYRHDPMMHGPILYHWTALMYLLFGVSDFTARLFGAVSGIVLVATPLLLRKWLGRSGALVAGILLLLSPSVMMYSRYIRHDIPVELATVLMLIGFVRYLDDRQPKWIVTAFVGGLIGITSAEMSYITGFMLVSFIALALWVESAGRRNDDWLLWAQRFGLALALGLGGFAVRTFAKSAAMGAGTPAEATLVPWQIAAIGVALVIALGVAVPLVAQALGVRSTPGWRSPMGYGLALIGAGAVLLLALDPAATAGSFNWYMAKVAISLLVAGAPVVAIAAVGSFIELPAAANRLGLLVSGAVAALFYIVVAEGLIHHGVTTAFDSAYYAWQIAAAAALIALGVWAVTMLPRDRVWALLAVVGLASLVFDLAVQYGANAERFAGFRQQASIIGGVGIALGFAALALEVQGRLSGGARAVARWTNALWPLLLGPSIGLAAFAATTFGMADVAHLTKTAEPLAVGAGVLLALAVGAALLNAARPKPTVLGQLNGLPYEGLLVGIVVFVVLYIALFTTWFQETDLANGFARSLQYWWGQHDVQRGGQPWYFYILVIGPLYEWLPMILCLCAVAVYGRLPALRFHRGNDSGDPLSPSPAAWVFVPMIVVWMLGVWWIFSWAGEKMPWLITHMAVPMCLLGARFVADVMSGIDVPAWRAKGWQLTAMTVAAFALLAGLVARTTSLAAAEASRPAAVGWGVAVVIVIALVVGVRTVGADLVSAQRRKAVVVGAMLFGLVVSAGYALQANFKNSELGTEYLVYAHGTPDDKEIYDLLKRMDTARPDEPLKLGFDNEVSWPYTWYFRNICPPRARGLAADFLCLLGQGCPSADTCSDWRQDPKYLAEGKTVDVAGLKELDAVLVGSPNYGNFEPYLRKDFVAVEVNRMYWPNEGYKGLTWPRIREAFVNPDLRANLLRIIFHREYVTDPTARPLVPKSLDDWFYHAKMKLWVKKSSAQALAATGQSWPDWMTDVEVAQAPDHSVPFNVDQAFSEANGVPFNAPKDIALAPDGSLYVLDHGNKRIAHLAADGTTIAVIDTPVLQYGEKDTELQPSAWGIGVGADGAVYVADTWNNRILHYMDDRWTEKSFGIGGVPEGGADKDLDKLFGPRDVAVGPGGEIFFTDTGNKRIIVLDPAMAAVRSIGKEGPAAGEFNEPVAVAFDPATGEMVVADLWNLRVQVFSKDLLPVREWAVDGWGSKEAAHKGYVAVGPNSTVLVTDPQGARVWIYDSTGKILGTLDLENDPIGLMQPIGIAVSATGQIYVASSEKNVVSRYDWPESLRAAAGLSDGGPPVVPGEGTPSDGTAADGTPTASTTPPTPTPTVATPAPSPTTGDVGDAGGANGSPLPSPTLGQAAKP
ncbi:MAG: TIGR03663 family protein [Ardenticatenales bacterium]|nr:TIGR03663 family protein [Ardenticatenales bacterium]